MTPRQAKVRVQILDDPYEPVRYVLFRDRYGRQVTWTLNAARRPTEPNLRHLAKAIFYTHPTLIGRVTRWAWNDYSDRAAAIAALNRHATQLADELADEEEKWIDDDPWVQAVGDPLKAKTWHGIPINERTWWS